MEDVNRGSMDADIVCVGLGPATGGFLTTLSKKLLNEDGTPHLESRVMPGMPLQVMCYERADDTGFGVSGVVSKARAIRASFPDLKASDIPMAADVKKEKLVYLLDSTGASNRSIVFRIADKVIIALRWLPFYKNQAFEFPFIPPFMNKHGGLIFSIGQFNQWVGSQLMGTGLVQLWPGTPVGGPIFEGSSVKGVRLVDQGVDLKGNPTGTFMPGMDIKADLTVVGDGPVGITGRKIDEKFGFPDGGERKDWAVGTRMLIELKEDAGLEPGTIIHTLGYPEPEIFGFLYVHPGGVASAGIFIPSWFDNPVRTSYRYLQHWMKHPYLWKYLKGGKLKSWGAKSLQESGKRGEPHLVGDGYARIGEGSGSTNLLSNSGVDEAWMTGTLLAEAVIELAEKSLPFTKENLEKTYVARRKKSWLEKEAKIAKKARDGFQAGVAQGLIGTTLTWLSRGLISYPAKTRATHERLPLIKDYYRGKISPEKIDEIKKEAFSKGSALHDKFMEMDGWPAIDFDGKLFVSHQDALLMGGKVQAPAGFKNHVSFIDSELCKKCDNMVCIEMCSAQAITPGVDGIPEFDREKCIHCGVCLWNCTQTLKGERDKTNIYFEAGAGGLHSVEN